MRQIGYNSQRDNTIVNGIAGSSQCFATVAWMLLSWYAPEKYKAEDDSGLKNYIASVTKLSTNDEYEWSSQGKFIQKYLYDAGLKSTINYGIDLNTGKPTCHAEGLKALLSIKPVIIGTKKMAGLPGGHIILGVDNAEDGGIVCHDPYGRASSGYADKNGKNVVYPIAMFDAKYPDMVRAMWFDIN